MTKGISTDELRTVAASAGATALLFMSGFLVLFTPLPMLYVFLTRGRRVAVPAMLIALAAVGGVYAFLLPWLTAKAVAGETVFLALPGMGLIDHMSPGGICYFGGAYFFFFIAVAYALGDGAAKKWKLIRWVGVSIAAGMGCIAAAALLAKIVSGASLVGGMRGYIDTVIAEIVSLNETAGVSNAQLQYLSQHGQEVASTLLSLVPSILFVFVLLTVVLNMLVGRKFARIPRPAARLRRAVAFRLPDYVIWIVVGCGATFFLDGYLLHSGMLKLIAINGLIATCALYFFQGFAVLAFFLEKVKSRMLRLLVYVAVVIFFQTVGLMFIGLGIADVWVHFRERARRTKSSEAQLRR